MVSIHWSLFKNLAKEYRPRIITCMYNVCFERLPPSPDGFSQVSGPFEMGYRRKLFDFWHSDRPGVAF